MIIGSFLKNNLKTLGIGLILNSAIYGMEEKEEVSVSSTITEPFIYANFTDFDGITNSLEYIKKCMPQLDPTQTLNAVSVLEKLKADGQSEIFRDGIINQNANSNVSIEVEYVELGYNFPPILKIQGPYLSQCKQGRNILDIGSGHGNDSIMSCISEANVIAVDILQKELTYLKERAAENLKNFPQYKLSDLKKDFSKAGSVPEQYIGKIQIINANKVMHFLDEQETINFIDNAHLMLSNDGLMFITNATPTQTHESAGVCYTKRTINFNIELGTESEVGKKKITKEESLLKALRNKRQSVDFSKSQSYEYYGRHFHTIDTFRDYFSPKFDILEHTNVRGVSGELFISIIAKKRSCVA